MTNALDGADAHAHALHYHTLGWKVVPIERGYKYPRGIDAWQTLDPTPDDLHRWFNGRDLNIGIICGERSGIFALDVDPRHGGDDTLAALERLHGKLPDTVEAITGGGGRHLIFRYPPLTGATLANSAGQLGPGLDIRAQGGQIVAAPSVHPETGARYEWEASSRPGEVPIADPPRWLLDLLTEKATELPAGQIGDRQWQTEFAIDHYNSVHSNADVAAMLEAHGWHSRRTDRNGVTYLTRPGKDDRSVGISIGKIAPGVAYCFTSSVPELTDGRGYSPFALHAALAHNDDWAAADAALVNAGWGHPTFAIDDQELAEWVARHTAGGVSTAAAAITAGTGRDGALVDLHTFLASTDPEHDWLIPGLLEREERVIVTAPEGGGKSTFLRQFAVMAAAGLHPFGGPDHDPLVVAIVDLENSERHLRRKLRALTECAPNSIGRGQLWIANVPEGIDLMSRDHAVWLDAELGSIEPDLVVIGPIYKMSDGDPIEELPAKAVIKVLDIIRTRYRCAMLIEAHSPNEQGGGKRTERPYGASAWRRWPEYGLHLAADGALRHWRGARDEREWPTRLRRGESIEWPFMPFVGKDQTYAQLLDVVQAAGKVLTERELADAIGVGKTTVHRMIKNNEKHWHSYIERFRNSLDEGE